MQILFILHLFCQWMNQESLWNEETIISSFCRSRSIFIHWTSTIIHRLPHCCSRCQFIFNFITFLTYINPSRYFLWFKGLKVRCRRYQNKYWVILMLSLQPYKGIFGRKVVDISHFHFFSRPTHCTLLWSVFHRHRCTSSSIFASFMSNLVRRKNRSLHSVCSLITLTHERVCIIERVTLQSFVSLLSSSLLLPFLPFHCSE